MERGEVEEVGGAIGEDGREGETWEMRLRMTTG